MEPADKSTGENMTFEDALTRLEKIVSRLEQAEVPLEESVEHYEEGIKLSRYCSEILEKAELRVEHVNRNENASE